MAPVEVYVDARQGDLSLRISERAGDGVRLWVMSGTIALALDIEPAQLRQFATVVASHVRPQ